MSTRPVYVGIDLGTTNSAAAVFDGESITLVRNRHGATLTPSVVRIDARGNVTVGERARRALDTDPGNTRAEFKRLMGTDQAFRFAARKELVTPEALAAEVLKALRQDIADQTGVLPDRAVISVPALFELPQIAATSEAARLAGFARVEVIQEPVASAIAAGWSVGDPGRHWLVYDLGGGTFDVSLLETREGLLRVVGHDGDNFLGGRDFDGVIVDLVLADLSVGGVIVDRADPAHAVGLRRLRHAAEEAKIELARAVEAPIDLPGVFTVEGEPVDVAFTLTREAFEAAAAPLVDRSVAVCERLLTANGIRPQELDRIVLVGGPTVIPMLRRRVAAALGAPFGEGLDPMTLVAQGAALYAATAGVDGRPRPPEVVPEGGPARKVWLQYPAVSSDPFPFLVGRVLAGEGGPIAAVRISRGDGGWESELEPVDEEGTFAVSLALAIRQASTFTIVARRADGAEVPVQPPTFGIMHGITVTDPPLSRSIGVALADGGVHVYFERGTPLPMRRTFTHNTVETVAPGYSEVVLKVPIVQGEADEAHLCRLVGSITIPGADVRAILPAGSKVEITLELDRGGRLAATAYVPGLEQTFEQVALLVVPRLSIEAVEANLGTLRTRAGTMQAAAFRRGDHDAIGKIGEAMRLFDEVRLGLAAARGGDADAGEKARRAVLEADGLVAAVESHQQWPDFEERTRLVMSWATGWVGQYGTATERSILDDSVARMEPLLRGRKEEEARRQLGPIRTLGNACYYRAPGAWAGELKHLASRVVETTDVVKARTLVKEGEAAALKGDERVVERVVGELWRLFPPSVEARKLGHDSGVR